MLKTEQLSKKYDAFAALDSVSMTVRPASIYGLVGTNGAGKTTLLKIISGIYKQNQGQVQLFGEPVYENSKMKQRLFFMPDNLFFFSQHTLHQMASWYAKNYNNWNQERYIKLIEGFELDPMKYLDKLSKGTQRQAAFCLALSTMPDLLILDEPLDGLDPVMRHKVKNLMIQDVAERGMSVLISSHNLRELEDLCDAVGVLHQGKLLIEKDLDDMKSNLHKIQVAFDSTNPPNNTGLDILYTEERGSVHLHVVRGERNDILSTFKAQNPLLLDILPLTLEEIFIYEMGGHGYEINNIIL